MSKPTKILMQTTIPTVEDDWPIARFSRLRAFLTGLQSLSGAALFEVTARDRGPLGIPDPVLSNLNNLDFESLWLFGVDTGDGLTKEDCRGISLFRKRGGWPHATIWILAAPCALWVVLATPITSPAKTLIPMSADEWSTVRTQQTFFGEISTRARTVTSRRSQSSSRYIRC
jgi:hypothetical protein